MIELRSKFPLVIECWNGWRRLNSSPNICRTEAFAHLAVAIPRTILPARVAGPSIVSNYTTHKRQGDKKATLIATNRNYLAPNMPHIENWLFKICEKAYKAVSLFTPFPADNPSKAGVQISCLLVCFFENESTTPSRPISVEVSEVC